MCFIDHFSVLDDPRKDIKHSLVMRKSSGYASTDLTSTVSPSMTQ